MTDNKILYILTIFSVGISVIAIAMSLSLPLKAPNPVAPEKAEKEKVTIDTLNTVCYVFDMSKSGWKPLSYSNRQDIGLLVSERKAEWMESYLIDCYNKDPKSQYLLDKVVTLKTEMWKRTPKVKK